MGNIGKNLRVLRQRRGMSIDRVARMMSVAPEVVEKWESGKKPPSQEDVNLLARFFDVSMSEISGIHKDKVKSELEDTPQPAETVSAAESAGGMAKGAADTAKGAADTAKGAADAAKGAGDTAKGAGGADSKAGRSESFSGGEEYIRIPVGGDERLKLKHSPLGAYLADGEKVLWHGQPTAEHVGGREGNLLRAFGVFWLLFALFWTLIAVNIGGAFGLFGLFFIGVGLYMIFGKSMVLNNNKRNIYYAVTNKRVMLCIIGRINRFRDISYGSLREVRLILSRQGTGCGTIVFITPTHAPQYSYGRYDRTQNTYNLLDSFIDIADAKRVYEIINEAKADYYEDK